MTTNANKKFVESCMAWKTSAIAVQKESHNLLKQAASWYFTHSFDTSRISILLNTMNDVPGFRIEAVKSYSEEFLGVSITDSEDKQTFIIKRNRKADVDGDVAMEQVRATPWYIWAPNEKPLKVPVFAASWTLQMARAVAIGEETEESLLENFSGSRVKEIMKVSKDRKSTEWAEKYFIQNPKDEEPEQMDAAIAETGDEIPEGVIPIVMPVEAATPVLAS